MLAISVRPRQLKVGTLLAGMCMAQADHRPAHLTRVHQALTSLPGEEQWRLGVIADWNHGQRQLRPAPDSGAIPRRIDLTPADGSTQRFARVRVAAGQR